MKELAQFKRDRRLLTRQCREVTPETVAKEED